MKTTIEHLQRMRRCRAFSLVELMVSLGLFGMGAVGLYTGIAQGFAVVQLARENLRATQILCEKAETLRLYTWDQINTPGFVPRGFTAPFYPTGDGQTAGIDYLGQLTILPLNLSDTTYAADLREVRIDLIWKSGEVERHRRMTTWVSRYGLHRYIY